MRIFKNISTLLTNDKLTTTCHAKVVQEDLGLLHKAWLLVSDDGKVIDYGNGPIDEKYKETECKDLDGAFVMPGLVDCHTHPVFAGDRSDEFCMRLEGKTYQQIGEEGGGIRSTIEKTRLATDIELSTLIESRLRRMTKLGTTTFEVKTGYGQSEEEELRQLRILKNLKKQLPQNIKVTLLALHALPRGENDYNAFTKIMVGNLLDIAAKENLCDYVDGFVEKGYFSKENIESLFSRAKDLGIGMRLHADQFTTQKAVSMAAEMGAASVDHLEYTSDDCIKKLSNTNTVAVILPGTSLYTDIKYANARKFIDNGVSVALSTDYNPGSCIIDNLHFIASLGAIHCRLSPAEAIAAVTMQAAKSLDLQNSKGSLAKGYDADFLVYDMKDEKQWLADFGRSTPKQVYLKGNLFE